MRFRMKYLRFLPNDYDFTQKFPIFWLKCLIIWAGDWDFYQNVRYFYFNVGYIEQNIRDFDQNSCRPKFSTFWSINLRFDQNVKDFHGNEIFKI